MAVNELNILQIILDSGLVVKLVLILLIIASVVSWAIIYLKRRTVKQIEKNNKEFLEIYHQSENLKEIMDSCADLPYSPYRAMFIHGFEELQKIKENYKGPNQVGQIKDHFEKFGMGVLERALKKGINESSLLMNKSLATLASIGSISPFIGLFGTVWGIINSFTGLAGGGATLDAVAPGIAEALVATAVGLAAAIPAVWFYNHYNNKNNKIISDMDSFEQEFLNIVERSLT